jgi:small subunit ribosomal protein S13
MVLRISGNQIQTNIKLQQALTQLFGIGNARSIRICKKIGCQKNATISSLKNQQLNQLKKNLEQGFLLNKRFKNLINSEIEALKKKKCYRGVRHFQKLPVRGQRTSTNAKTARKKR